MKSLINVAIVENDNLSRIGAANILLNTGKVEICGSIRSLNEVIKIVQKSRIDVVVLNIDLLSNEEIKTIHNIKSHPNTKIVITTSEKNREAIGAAIRAGADCCYCKNSQGENLAEKFIEAVFSAYNNESWIDPSLSRILIENLVSDDNKSTEYQLNKLSTKEITCLKLVATGIKSDVIAERMHVAKGTISSYLHSIFTKLNVNDKLNAVRKGIQFGIITHEDMKLNCVEQEIVVRIEQDSKKQAA